MIELMRFFIEYSSQASLLRELGRSGDVMCCILIILGLGERLSHTFFSSRNAKFGKAILSLSIPFLFVTESLFALVQEGVAIFA